MQQTKITDFKAERMTAREVADYLGMDQRYFAEKFCFTPGFPVAIRLADRGTRIWLRTEINGWLETRRETA